MLIAKVGVPILDPHRKAHVGWRIAGYAKTHIILPSTIYGIANNVLVDEDIANGHSIQVPALIRASVLRGRGGIVGQGKNLWPDVNIEDGPCLYFSSI